MPPKLHDLDKAEMAVLDTVQKLRKAKKGAPVTSHPEYFTARGNWEAVAEDLYKGGSALDRARQKLGEAVNAVIENVDKGKI